MKEGKQETSWRHDSSESQSHQVCETRPTLRKTVVNFQNKTEKNPKGFRGKKDDRPSKTENLIEIRCVNWQHPVLEGKGSISEEKLFWIRNSLLRWSFNFIVKVKLGHIMTRKGHPETVKSSQNSLSYCQA